MSDAIKTIDERLREKARRQLTAEVRAAMAPLRNFLNGGSRHAGHVRLANYCRVENGSAIAQPARLDSMLSAIEEAVIERFASDYGEATVEEFMKRFDTLQSEFEELRDSVAS